MKRILVAGIGNIFLGDDAFGVEVVRVLSGRGLPPEANVMDFGTRSYDLAITMLEGYSATILVDATPRGQAPGTLSLIEADLSEPDQMAEELPNSHTLNPERVLDVVRLFGGEAGRVFVVECEPELLQSPDGKMGLSPSVQAAVPQAIEMIECLINRLLEGETEEQTLALKRAGQKELKPYSISISSKEADTII